MKLILKKSVPNLGQEGDCVTVKAGYARNFLLPRKLAVEATKGGMKVLEQEKRGRETRILAVQQEAGALAEKINETEIVLEERNVLPIGSHSF